ncbi:MAG: ABC transporter ATP-binding protein [Caldilineales bacterium]|nr:ABC transporter ATP-binding protein [Caldilineales bacterium]MDW8316833.1 ABC transporter ATP-binding protein [Anaerolineae bacterium]
MSDPVILTHELTRCFGSLVAVNRLSLEVAQGEVFGFLGHNGAGKTTTVRLLNGVLAASGGQARVLGLDPASQGTALRRRTGVLTESPSLDERLTARDNLAIFADLYGVPRERVRRRIAELLEHFELADRADEKVGGYSKGMKQRLALARALLHEPDLLFLDEPTAALDPVAARGVHELILRMARQEGRTVFLCTHNLVEAQRLCDRVGVMEQGRLVAVGAPQELARRYVHNLTVEVEVAPEDTDTALQALAGLPVAVQPGSPRGQLAVSGVRREAIPALVAALVHAGVAVYGVAPQEPSLEDVYFALHGEGVHGQREVSP